MISRFLNLSPHPPCRPSTASAIAALFLLLSVGGCESGNPALTAVHGRVSYNGIPLHTGLVVFTPDPLRGTVGPSASGEIQPDGSYTLFTGDKPGAVEGWHRVTIIAVEAAASFGGTPQSVPRSLLPDKYRDPDLSGLICEIKAAQDNRIDFNLD